MSAGLVEESSGQRAREEAGLESLWYLVAISGVVSLVVGILVLAYPDPSVKLLGVFLGIDLLLTGVGLIVRGVSARADPENGPAALMLGTLALVAGLIVIRNPGESLVLIVLAFAIYAIAAGALAFARAILVRGQRAALIVKGIVLVGLGTVIISWPDISLTTLAVLAGIALCLQGVIEIAEGLLLRSLGRAEAGG
jgi:uncharacterized membrane protein HdeD (DUF308 family)